MGGFFLGIKSLGSGEGLDSPSGWLRNGHDPNPEVDCQGSCCGLGSFVEYARNILSWAKGDFDTVVF